MAEYYGVAVCYDSSTNTMKKGDDCFKDVKDISSELISTFSLVGADVVLNSTTQKYEITSPKNLTDTEKTVVEDKIDVDTVTADDISSVSKTDTMNKTDFMSRLKDNQDSNNSRLDIQNDLISKQIAKQSEHNNLFAQLVDQIKQQNKIMIDNQQIIIDSISANKIKDDYMMTVNTKQNLNSIDINESISSLKTSIDSLELNSTIDTTDINNSISSIDTAVTSLDSAVTSIESLVTSIDSSNSNISTALDVLTSTEHITKKENFYTSSKTKNDAVSEKLTFEKDGILTLKDSSDNVIKPREAKALHNAEKAKETKDMNETDFISSVIDFFDVDDEDEESNFSNINFEDVLNNDNKNPLSALINIAKQDIQKVSNDIYSNPEKIQEYIQTKQGETNQ